MHNYTALEAAFLATTYTASEKNGTTFHLKINEQNEAFDRFLRKKNIMTWAYVTAWNPAARQQDDLKNIELNRQLEQILKNLGYTYLKGFGVPPEGSTWQPEASFLILGIRQEDALQLGKKFHQAAILCGKTGEVANLIWI